MNPIEPDDHLPMTKVFVGPYDPNWADAFTAEARRIRSALGETAVAVHHIGSTAIPGIYAKPIIDILLVVSDLESLDLASSALMQLGYEGKGEFGIPERRYFRKISPEGVRTHQIHAFKRGSAEVRRHLAFRDYMIAHPAVAESYGRLKQQLAAAFPNNIEAYIEGKNSFVKEHEKKAVAWEMLCRRTEFRGPPMEHEGRTEE